MIFMYMKFIFNFGSLGMWFYVVHLTSMAINVGLRGFINLTKFLYTSLAELLINKFHVIDYFLMDL